MSSGFMFLQFHVKTSTSPTVSPATRRFDGPSAGHDQTDGNQATGRPNRTPLTCNGTTLPTTNEHTRMGPRRGRDHLILALQP